MNQKTTLSRGRGGGGGAEGFKYGRLLVYQ